MVIDYPSLVYREEGGKGKGKGGKPAKGSARSRKPLFAEALQLREWLSVTEKEQGPASKRGLPARPDLAEVRLGEDEALEPRSYAMATLADMLRALFKGDFRVPMALFPCLRYPTLNPNDLIIF